MLTRIEIEEGVDDRGRKRWFVHYWFQEGGRQFCSRDRIGWESLEHAESERDRALAAARKPPHKPGPGSES